MSTDDLTTTSYAILGLLAVKPWTTYELAQQMDRSIKSFWPRAQSRIYAEPKRLVEEGLATAHSDRVGRRPRTTYSITKRGRRVLRAWLAEPGDGPSLELEALLKVFFAEHGAKEDVLTNIDALRAWADHQNEVNVGFARRYCAGDGEFPERLASIALTGTFLTDFADMVDRWATWARSEVEAWPSDTSTAEPAWDVLRAIAARQLGADR